MKNLMKLAQLGAIVPVAHSAFVPAPDVVQELSARPQATLLDALKRARMLLVAIAFLCLTISAHAQTWSGVLSTNRGVDWSQAGIPGGIPSGSWAQCGSTIAPYSGSANAIINALNSCSANHYVLLGPGTFNLTSSIITTGLNNVELRGSGANSTFLVFSGVSTCQNGNGTCLIGFQGADSTYPNQPPANIYNWTAGYAKGATSISLSSGANIVANSTVLVLDGCDTGYSGTNCSSGASTDNGNFFECSDLYNSGNGCSANGPDTGLARTHRFESEYVQVTSCSPACGSSGSTVVTVTPPLIHPNWPSVQSPQAWLFQPSQYVGVRNLSVDGSATTDTAGISLANTANSWVQGVRVLHAYNIGIWAPQNFRSNIVDNYVFDAGQHLRYPDPTGIKYNGGSFLIQNNIIQAVRPFTLAEGPSSGSVIAYNFGINSYTHDDFLFVGFLNHSTGDDLNLFEGNVGDLMQEDQIHGSHLMNTLFRNFFTAYESCVNGNCGNNSAKDSNLSAIGDLSYSRYMNIVGNVLGTPGSTTGGYTSSTAEAILGGTAGWVYILGSGNSGGTATLPYDPVTASTAVRWCNWDVVNGSIQCNAAENGSGARTYPGLSSPSTTLPSSFYLFSKPAWFGGIPFPPVGPDVSNGNVGQCGGTINVTSQAGVAATAVGQCPGGGLNPAWAGHVNAIPAMTCYLNSMSGPPDGSGNALVFNPQACYPSTGGGGSSSSQAPNPPTNLQVAVQ